MNCLDVEASVENLSFSSHGRFSCAESQHPSVAKIRIPYATYLFSFSSLEPFRRQHSSQSIPKLAGSSSNKQQCRKAPILPPVVVPTPVFKSATNSVPGTRLLGGRVRHDRFVSSRPRYCRCIRWRNYSRKALGRPSSKFVSCK